jgi:hypothetical protein
LSQSTKEDVAIRNNEFSVRKCDGDIIKNSKYKIKKIPVMYSEALLLKFKATSGVLNNITSIGCSCSDASYRR